MLERLKLVLVEQLQFDPSDAAALTDAIAGYAHMGPSLTLGGVVLEDRNEGSSVVFTAPRDVVLNAPRDAVLNAPRDAVFRYSKTPYTACLDAHVLLVPGAIDALLNYFREHPDTHRVADHLDNL